MRGKKEAEWLSRLADAVERDDLETFSAIAVFHPSAKNASGVGGYSLPLLLTAAKRSPKVLKAMMDADWDLSVRGIDGCTAVHHAATSSSGSECLRILLSSGKFFDFHDALPIAVRGGCPAIVKMLLEAGCRTTEAPISYGDTPSYPIFDVPFHYPDPSSFDSERRAVIDLMFMASPESARTAFLEHALERHPFSPVTKHIEALSKAVSENVAFSDEIQTPESSPRRRI